MTSFVVIEERVSVDVMNKSYVSDMEMRLAGIYDEGFRRLKENKVRNRRATTVGDTTLQVRIRYTTCNIPLFNHLTCAFH